MSSITYTIATLRARTIEVGDCWEWLGGYATGGRYPQVRHAGKPSMVRRVVLRLSGIELLAGRHVTTTCDNHRCVNPEHLRQATIQEISAKAGAQGLMSSPARGAKIAATKRAQMAVLTIEQVREIRQHTTTHAAAAAQYGVHPSKIAAIRQHRCWKDYQVPNPFAGLGARA